MLVRPDIVVVRHVILGKGEAVRAGFAAATGDLVVLIDADGSMDPAEIPGVRLRVGPRQRPCEGVALPSRGRDRRYFPSAQFGNAGLWCGSRTCCSQLRTPSCATATWPSVEAVARTRSALIGFRDRDRDRGQDGSCRVCGPGDPQLRVATVRNLEPQHLSGRLACPCAHSCASDTPRASWNPFLPDPVSQPSADRQVRGSTGRAPVTSRTRTPINRVPEHYTDEHPGHLPAPLRSLSLDGLVRQGRLRDRRA